jgi:peroxiredoxin/predicted 2-oxoglutarate/Fe(II)-dependent dioxygenase YbiX
MLIPGDSAPHFNLLNHEENRFILRDRVGSLLVFLFYASDADPRNLELLQTLEKQYAALKTVEAQVYGVSLDTIAQRRAVIEAHGISFPLLCDTDLAVSSLLGLCEIDPLEGDDALHYPPTLVVLDRNLRILYVDQNTHPEAIAERVALLQAYHPAQPQTVFTDSTFPPVLLIPNVLEPSICKELIEVYETQGNQDSYFMKADGDVTYGVVDSRIKIRRDHYIRSEDLKFSINRIFQKRLYPEIERCLNYEVAEYEHFKLACYDSQTGGYFRPHRDNTSGGTAHRRWALSLNLNSEDYEGGYLRFPEYGPQLFKPATGSAIIFSCSLMHEATDVHNGKRYVLLSFLYGEQESAQRLAYQKAYGTERYIPKDLT